MPVERRIMVVDDAAVFGFALSLEFRAAGWSVYCCGSGEDALKQLVTSHFDIVLSDVHMPGIDGISLANQIKERFPAVRVLLMSSAPRDQLTNLPKGVPFLPKPVKAKMILDAYDAIAKAVSTGPHARPAI